MYTYTHDTAVLAAGRKFVADLSYLRLHPLPLSRADDPTRLLFRTMIGKMEMETSGQQNLPQANAINVTL